MLASVPACASAVVAKIGVSVGFPDTPSPLVTVIDEFPVIVRPANVSAAVCVRIPLVLYAARDVRVASSGCLAFSWV